MTYTTKKCPYCGHAYVVLDPCRGVAYGSPLIVCPCCNKSFFDKDNIEIAVSGVRKSDIRRFSVSTLVKAIVSTLFEIVSIYCFCFDFPEYRWLLFFVTFFCLVSWWLFIREVRSYTSRIEFIQKETVASRSRLSNPEYAKLLKDNGYQVPEQYLICNNSHSDYERSTT